MEIPLYVFLIIYVVILSAFGVWAFFNLYHIIKFGFFDFTGKLNTFIFAFFILLVMIVTALLLRSVFWFDIISLETFGFDLFLGGEELDI